METLAMNIEPGSGLNIEPGSGQTAQEIAAATDTLRGTLRGEILTEADAGYDAARAVWNAMIDRRPVVIVQPKGVADVIEAVNFARTHGLPAPSMSTRKPAAPGSKAAAPGATSTAKARCSGLQPPAA
jgi:FAD/FMN-containing dehydrogenase